MANKIAGKLNENLDSLISVTEKDTNYSYGLRVSLTLDQLKELGADNPLPMGLKLYMEANVKVVSVSLNEDMGSTSGSVQLQITDMCLHSPEHETEEEKTERTKKKSSSEVIYGSR